MEWYRNNKAAVAEELRRGERPDLATTMASCPLDELDVQRERAGVRGRIHAVDGSGLGDDLRLVALVCVCRSPVRSL